MIINLRYKLLFLIGIIMISIGGIMINNVEPIKNTADIKKIIQYFKKRDLK